MTMVSYYKLDQSELNGKVRPGLRIQGTNMPYKPNPKYLGVHLDAQLTFAGHCDLRALHPAYTKPVTLYCAGSWLTMASESN